MTKPYRMSPAPEEYDPAYLERELTAIEDAGDAALDLEGDFDPDYPQEGMVRYFKDSVYDPGAGSGAYIYTGTRWLKLATVATGEYTGDGAASQSITGLGFMPQRLLLGVRVTVPTVGGFYTWTTSAILDDSVSGMAVDMASGNTGTGIIVSLDSDGFTVSSSKNSLGQVYNYWAVG